MNIGIVQDGELKLIPAEGDCSVCDSYDDIRVKCVIFNRSVNDCCPLSCCLMIKMLKPCNCCGNMPIVDKGIRCPRACQDKAETIELWNKAQAQEEA